MCDDKKDRSSLGRNLADEPLEFVLHKGIQTRGGFVEHDELGTMQKYLHESDLLAVSSGELVDGPMKLDAEPLDEVVALARVDAAAQACEPVEQLLCCDVAEQHRVSGEVSDASANREAVAVTVETQHAGGTGGWPQEVEQHSDRCRLAGTVGTEEAEDRPGRDCEG